MCKIYDKYYVTWCNGYHGPTIGIAWTKDFKTFHQLENAFLPYNRNGVMFPRKINGNYAMLSRPSDTGYTPFGAALLDLEQPWKVLKRTGPYLLHPETLYECTGDVPNVCFPCAALHDPQTGRVAVYYGAADTVVGVAFG